MLEEKIRLSYPWIKIKNETDEMLCRLGLAEDQEEAEMFLFRLYVENELDLSFFDERERERVRGFLNFLIEDSRHHKELLAEMVGTLREMEEVADEPGTT